jgi:putative peptidoglycan lipid II flippase
VAAPKTPRVSKHAKNIGIVSGLTMLSRVLGLVRESLTARAFGVNALVSAFFTGFTLPNLFRRLLAEGGLTAAFVPTINEELHLRQREGAFRLVNQVMTWLLVVTTALVAFAMIGLSQDGWIRAAGRAFGADAKTIERWLLAAWFAVMLFPYLIFVSLAAVFSGALQSLHRFVEPALSPLWLNLAIIGMLVGGARWGHGDQICWLAGGAMIGGFLQMVVPGLALRREGWRPRLDFQVNDPIRAMLRLMAPTVFSSSIYLVNMSMSRVIGLSLNDAAVSVLNYAQRLMELPIGVFAVAVSTVVFPLISRYAAAGDRANLARSYGKGLRLILVINIPAAAGLVVLAEPIIRVIFQHGQFDPEATAMMAPVLIANGVGLPFLSFANLALRAFYAQKDTAVPMRAAMLSFVINLVLSLALMGPLSTLGLAIASSVAAVAQAFFLQWHLTRKDGTLAFRGHLRDLVKIAVASAGMTAVVALGWRAWATTVPAAKVADTFGLLTLVALGAMVYGSFVWMLRIEGREDVAAIWAKLRGRAA